MLRWLMVFGGILVLNGITFPFLHEVGLAQLPGDVVLDLEGYRFFLPVTTSLLISSAIAGAWRLLEP